MCHRFLLDCGQSVPIVGYRKYVSIVHLIVASHVFLEEEHLKVTIAVSLRLADLDRMSLF